MMDIKTVNGRRSVVLTVNPATVRLRYQGFGVPERRLREWKQQEVQSVVFDYGGGGKNVFSVDLLTFLRSPLLEVVGGDVVRYVSLFDMEVLAGSTLGVGGSVL